MTASCVLLLLLLVPVILRNFSDHLFYRTPLGNSLFHVDAAEIQPPDKIKSISEVLFRHFIQKRDMAIRGGVHLLKIPDNHL